MKQKAIFKGVKVALSLLQSHLQKVLQNDLEEKRRRRLSTILDVVSTLNALLNMSD